jgi:large subunit ribosomal protein L21
LRRRARAAAFEVRASHQEQGELVYAVVASGGKQHRVAVGDVVDVELLPGETGAAVNLPALLLIDGESVTTDADALASVAVTAEVVGVVKGPKIRIHKFKNKTGYHKRQGHRQKFTRLKVTGIETKEA